MANAEFKTSKPNIAEPRQAGDAPPMAYLEVTKVIRESVPVFDGGVGGMTLGQLVDDYMTQCAKDGVEVQELAVGFGDKNEWAKYADRLRNQALKY
jgi:hypothetical protein